MYALPQGKAGEAGCSIVVLLKMEPLGRHLPGKQLAGATKWAKKVLNSINRNVTDRFSVDFRQVHALSLPGKLGGVFRLAARLAAPVPAGPEPGIDLAASESPLPPTKEQQATTPSLSQRRHCEPSPQAMCDHTSQMSHVEVAHGFHSVLRHQ